MAGAYSTVDLSQLQAPDVVQQLDYEQIVAQMLADLQRRDPTFSALLESDPAYKIIEVCAYRELLMRQRVNDAAYAVMLAFARGADLDQIGANLGVTRLVIDPGNPDAVPPVAPTLESDTDLRYRIQISFEGYSTAGPQGAYVFHGLSADGQVKDVSATSPSPGVVRIHVLSRAAGGVPSVPLLETVAARLNDERVRPLTDSVEVLAATVVPFAIEAELTMYPGPDAAVIVSAAVKAAREYAESVYRLGFDVARSGILRALHQPGVQSVRLIAPAENIVISEGQAPLCTGVTVSTVGVDD